MPYRTSAHVVSELRETGLINAIIGAATTWKNCDKNSSEAILTVKIRIPAKCGRIQCEVTDTTFVYRDHLPKTENTDGMIVIKE